MSKGAAATETEQGPVGLGGWLILPMLGLIAAPLLGLGSIVTYIDLGETWPYLTAGQSAFVIGELAMNAFLLFLAPITLLCFMFKQLEIFPGWYMIWLGVAPIVVIIDAVLGYLMFPQAFAAGAAEIFDKETTRNLTRTVVSAAIWILYMMRSERVANTFIR